MPGQAARAVPVSHFTARKPEQSDKKHRCRRYSDLHEKRLREVVAKLTPEETETLQAGLVAQEISDVLQSESNKTVGAIQQKGGQL